jgi:hypothetical protein
MALTAFQRIVCRALAQARIDSGESYVAGGVALNELTGAARLSRDIDVFHDTQAAVHAAWQQDRLRLERQGFSIRVLRERPGYIEAEVRGPDDAVRMEWARDSAFRFFPLVTHADLGLTLHPVDLATNKVLALVGRLEVRGWVDVITSHDRIQPLGYLAWAASAKDRGFSPHAILEHAARTGRYSFEEVAGLEFAGQVPDAAVLSRRWHGMLEDARVLIAELPPEEAGTCVLTGSGDLCRVGSGELRSALAAGTVRFHRGRIRGALPQLRP